METFQQPPYWPTSTWRTADTQAFGLKRGDFMPLHHVAQEDERVHSILLIRSGYVIFEEYYHGWSQNHYHNVNSVTKNITSALVGIALREKRLARSISPFSLFSPNMPL